MHVSIYTLRAGKQRLDECLAKLGFSLDECRQQYALASLSLKQRLGEKLEAHAEEFNLMGLVYGSFSRTLGACRCGWLGEKVRESVCPCVVDSVWVCGCKSP